MDLYVLMQSVPVGGYISAYKVVPVLLVCVAWWRWLTWIDKDAPAAHLPREWINAGMVGGFAGALVLFLLIPLFWLALIVFIVMLLGEIGAYLGLRNSKVGLNDLVSDIKSIKFGSGKKQKEFQEVVGMATLATKDGRAMASPQAGTPERQIYDLVQLMIGEPLRRGMERLDLVPIEGATMAQYWVDGVVYNGAQFNRNGAAGAVTLLKRLAGLDLNEKRKPQTGLIQATIEGKRKEIQVQTAGSTAGESLRLMVEPKHRHDWRLDKVGFAPDQLQRIEAVTRESGVILVAIPKGQGLTSVLYALIRQHDAFLTQIQTIERAPEDDLEGVTQNALPRSVTPHDEMEKVQWVISQEPDTIVLAELHNAVTARALIGHAASGKRVYIGMRSNSAIDAINEWRTMLGDDELAMRQLRMVIAGRVVRKLCPACKQPYQPDPETLRKLNLDHGKVSQFFQARTHPMQDQKGNIIPCAFCAEMRYRGRTGVFEAMDINDEVRQAVIQNATPKQLLALFRKMRIRFTQEHAMDLVEKGETSIQEVLRAMRGQEQVPAPKGGGGGAAGTGAFGPSGTGSGTDAGKTHPVPKNR